MPNRLKRYLFNFIWLVAVLGVMDGLWSTIGPMVTEAHAKLVLWVFRLAGLSVVALYGWYGYTLYRDGDFFRDD